MSQICFQRFLRFWKSLVLILLPLAFIPLPIYIPTQESRCAYVMIVVAAFWMTEVLPLPVTALIPIFAFPVLGVLSTAEVSDAYMNRSIMVLFGGLAIALSLEHSNLHTRIALFVILRIGQSPRRLMAGFMITTMTLSMWIPNTASCAMMIPIIRAILKELLQIEDDEEVQGESPLLRETNPPQAENRLEQMDELAAIGIDSKATKTEIIARRKKSTVWLVEKEKAALTNMYFLSIAYAGNIGGTGSPIGTGPNLITKNLVENSFQGESGLNFGSWIVFNFPGLIINVFLAWVWLQYFFIGFRSNRFTKTSKDKEKAIRTIISKKYHDLGPVSFHEGVVIALFCFALLLWVLRNPRFIPGWAGALQMVCSWDINISDASPTILIVVLFFIIPSKLNFRSCRSSNQEESRRETEGCLTWEVVNSRLPWGTVLLIGGGFALAKGSDKSGLSLWLGEQMRALDIFPPFLVVFFTSLLTAVVTEVASNTAIASIVMPILKDLSLGLSMNPLFVLMPATACTSYAFVLPIATPPNALVYGAANMKTSVMMKAGIVMNLICIVVINVMINTLGVIMFDVHNFPSWANSSTSFEVIPSN